MDSECVATIIGYWRNSAISGCPKIRTTAPLVKQRNNAKRHDVLFPVGEHSVTVQFSPWCWVMSHAM